MTGDGKPVIGLTLRHDRIDNFWFVLMHELAHVGKHLANASESFFDDLDASSQDDLREKEAERLACEALIPQDEWRASPARSLRAPEAAQHLANKLRVHPAIIAGRMRYEANNFKILNTMVGFGEVRRLFPETQWKGESDV
jgi:HTH-type transcriptional regulator/antitoxin HigA